MVHKISNQHLYGWTELLRAFSHCYSYLYKNCFEFKTPRTTLQTADKGFLFNSSKICKHYHILLPLKCTNRSLKAVLLSWCQDTSAALCAGRVSPLCHTGHFVNEIFKKRQPSKQGPQPAGQPHHQSKAEVPMRHCSHYQCTCRYRLGIPDHLQVVSRNHSNDPGRETNRTGMSQCDPHTCLWP